jgi:ABC-type phosphate transport system substrate-binding protein
MEFNRIRFWCLTLVFLTAPVVPSSPSFAGAPIVFIVNSRNPVTSISREDLIEYYEKRRRLWPNGGEVRFIDRSPGSPERAAFLSEVLAESESDVQLYWFNQKFRSGNRMPIETSSNEMTIEAVRSFEGAIGYVSPSVASNAKGVKVIKVTGLGE